LFTGNLESQQSLLFRFSAAETSEKGQPPI
jgi:hypothetical protein